MNGASLALLAAVFAPFLATAAILLLRKRENLREGASLVAAAVSFLCSLSAMPAAFRHEPVSVDLGQMLPGIPLRITADGLGLLFACLASFLWILTTVFSIGYMRGLKEHAQTRYFACFALVIGATMGVALAANLLTLFLFYEILTVATWPLVVHKESEEAFAAGRKYLVYTLSGGVALLAGIAILWALGGPHALDFGPSGNGRIGETDMPAGMAKLAFFLLFAGFGVKAAIMPFHGWLPTAMIAPTPVSGLLHAVAVVKAGVFGILRLLYSLYGPDLVTGLGLQEPVILAAAFTIVAGSMLALVQDDLKARLAYSTISQLSYIVLGAALLVPGAAVGAFFGMAAHAFAKLTMFFVAGAVAVETGKTKVSQMDGVGRRMPWTFAAFGLATLSMASLPPMAGFVEKWYLGVGAWGSGRGWIIAVLVLSAVLNLAYFLPILLRAFTGPGEDARADARPALRTPLLLTAAGALFLGLVTFLPYGPFETARLVAADGLRQAMQDLPSFLAGRAIPPFVIFLAGGPLVLALPGASRRVGMVVLAGLALADVALLAPGTTWRVPFMETSLVLLNVDRLSWLTGLIFALITFLAVLYAAACSERRMHLFALLYAGSSLGAVFAGDWITVLLFWEIMAVTSTLLIAEHGGEAARASFRYLLFHGLGGALLAAGVALAWIETGSFALGPAPGGWAQWLVILGIGVNAGFIPLHTWLPDSYPRPHFAASVFLSVYTTKAAIYMLARTTPAEGYTWVALMGGLMAVYGVTFAVFQTNMRRLLSYHIISQVGYMVAGVGLAGALGTDGGMAHVFNHILYKALLFMTVGVIVWKTGEQVLDRLGGLQRRMPITALAYWIAAFSISGVPLFNGYVSKGMVITAAHEHSTVLWILLEAASFGTFLSFLKLGWFAFLRPGEARGEDPHPAMSAAMLGTAGLCLLIGIYPQALYGILPSGKVEYAAYGLGHLVETVAILGAAAAFFFTVGRRVLVPHEPRLRDANAIYEAGGAGTVRLGGVLQTAYRWAWGEVTGAADALFAAGRGALRMEDRDVNWNLVAYGGALVAVAAFLLAGVTG